MQIPNHIAFIMDGNGRWATSRLLPRNVGHSEGVKALKRVINGCMKYGVKVISKSCLGCSRPFSLEIYYTCVINLLG